MKSKFLISTIIVFYLSACVSVEQYTPPSEPYKKSFEFKPQDLSDWGTETTNNKQRENHSSYSQQEEKSNNSYAIPPVPVKVKKYDCNGSLFDVDIWDLFPWSRLFKIWQWLTRAEKIAELRKRGTLP